MSSTTICVTDTSVIPFPTLDSTHTQVSNAPVPHQPRKSARSSLPLSFSDTSISDSNSSEHSDTDPLHRRFPTPVRYDSSSSSSSTPSDEIRPTIIPRSKRVASQHSTPVQDKFIPVTPASTPVKPNTGRYLFTDLDNWKQTPLRVPSDDEDAVRQLPVLGQAPLCKVGKLRLEGSAGKHVRHTSDSNLISRPSVLVAPSASQPPQTIRKKSGQPIKSSLKSARRPDLHVVTNGSFAKSEPATPTQTKAVHFDSKLEHVKLFLAEQKPLAVSRDGSPTSDTSGDEFPSFIYGNASRETKHVKMLLPNMPSSPRKEDHVALQELILSQDQRTVIGTVRVRNIAYEKWLAIRFTLDWWQTTSEVTARYDKSIEGGTFDIFTFTIRLHDIWSRIEEKAIFIALRYTVAGQEFWDNNSGKNYHVKFVLDPPSDPSSAVDNDTSLKDLNSKLEVLAKTKSSPIPIIPYRLGRSFSADHQYSSFAKPSSNRHNFASASKSQWARNSSSLSSYHTRTNTYPSGVPATAGPTAAPWLETPEADETEELTVQLSTAPLESPREARNTTPTLPEARLASPDSPSPSRSPDGRERNHRRGFIDRIVDGSPTLRRTPTGSPLKFDISGRDAVTHLPRTRSYPLTAEKLGPMGQSAPRPPLSIQIAPVGNGSSEESTPSTASQSSSSSNSSSTPLISPSSDAAHCETSYKQFLDQFCFYTGADSLLQESPAGLLRSQSASGIDQYFLSHSPPSGFSSHIHTRFPYDASRPSTPTAVRV